MKLIKSITDDPKQEMTVTLDNGSKLNINLKYISSQQGWFISLSYGTTLIINDRRLAASPNILRAFRNVVDFGIACLTTDRQEPVFIDDFSNGRAKLYILNSDDVNYVEDSVIPLAP